MRLQCPNCDAEYEVDASAIPYDGRDVQCSNCGHGWYQTHPDFETDDAIEAALYDPPPPFDRPEASPAPSKAAASVAAKAAPVTSDVPKREIDPEALRILREEVAYEKAKRAAEKAAASSAPQQVQDLSLEAELDKMAMVDLPPPSAALTQNDLRVPIAPLETDFSGAPYSEQPNRSVVARRVARLKGTLDDSAAAISSGDGPAAAQPAMLAGLSQSGAQDLRQTKTNLSKRGQRAGFYTALLASLAATGAYIYSPQLATSLPQLEPSLVQYVSLINDLRVYAEIAADKGASIATQLVQRVLDFIAAQGWL